jgi:hypothetical protein
MKHLIGIIWFWLLVTGSFTLHYFFEKYDQDGYFETREGLINPTEIKWRTIMWVLATVTYWAVFISWARSERASNKWVHRLNVILIWPSVVLGLIGIPMSFFCILFFNM